MKERKRDRWYKKILKKQYCWDLFGTHVAPYFQFNENEDVGHGTWHPWVESSNMSCHELLFFGLD